MQSMAGTYSELDGHREVVHSDFLLNRISSRDPREVDEGRLDDALFALHRLDDLFGEAEKGPVSACQGLNNK